MDFPPEYATGIALWGLRQVFVALFDKGTAFTTTIHEQGFGLARLWDPESFPHQGFDAGSVLVSQPMRHFPEHDMVDAPKDVGGEFG